LVSNLQIVRSVRLLSYSLEGRIKPRHQFAQAHGVQLTPQLVRLADDKFKQVVLTNSTNRQ
jgi:hypothetical protein